MNHVKINILLLATVLIGVSSCLKKDFMNVDPSSGLGNVIEFNNTGNNVAKAASKYPRYWIDLGTVNTGQKGVLEVNVSYSGADAAPEDISVKLTLDTAALTLYNNTDGYHYVVPPVSVYKFPSEVIIKKGTRQIQTTVDITISSDFDFNDAYAIPLKIASTSTGVISGNFGTAIYSFGGRNKYDGVYMIKGYVSHPTPAYVGPFTAPEVEFSTTGATSIGMEAQPFSNAGTLSTFGVYPVFTVNADNSVTVSNMPDGGSAPSVTDPTYKNRYDPATKTFYISYSYNAATPRVVYDTCIYVRER